jgi:hypothetical protein
MTTRGALSLHSVERHQKAVPPNGGRAGCSVFVFFFLALLLATRVRAIPASGLRMMLCSHLLMMLRVHLLLMMLHLLIHRMRSVSRASVFGHFAGVRFGLVAPKILLVPVKVFGRMLVAVFFAAHSCSLDMMFSGRVSTFGFSFSRSGCPCGSDALCAFALLVALIK